MNYDLAKELMDAGFPQGGKGSWTHPRDAIVIRSHDRVYAPTLEELIEACGNKFGALYTSFDRKNPWAASNQKPELIDWQNLQSIHVNGATPTEAVARLWLALNARPVVE